VIDSFYFLHGKKIYYKKEKARKKTRKEAGDKACVREKAHKEAGCSFRFSEREGESEFAESALGRNTH
jgi:hypothetical protein